MTSGGGAPGAPGGGGGGAPSAPGGGGGGSEPRITSAEQALAILEEHAR